MEFLPLAGFKIYTGKKKKKKKNEVRGIAGENRLRCVRFSFDFCFFSSALDCRFSDHCCVSRSSDQCRACPSLFSHGLPLQARSGSAGYLPFVKLTDRTSACPTARSYAMSRSSLRPIFTFMLVPKSLWTL